MEDIIAYVIQDEDGTIRTINAPDKPADGDKVIQEVKKDSGVPLNDILDKGLMPSDLTKD